VSRTESLIVMLILGLNFPLITHKILFYKGLWEGEYQFQIGDTEKNTINILPMPYHNGASTNSDSHGLRNPLIASLGVSVFVPDGDAKDVITARVSFADYELVEGGESGEEADGRRKHEWRRKPRSPVEVDVPIEPKVLAKRHPAAGFPGTRFDRRGRGGRGAGVAQGSAGAVALPGQPGASPRCGVAEDERTSSRSSWRSGVRRASSRALTSEAKALRSGTSGSPIFSSETGLNTWSGMALQPSPSRRMAAWSLSGRPGCPLRRCLG